jgi:hypothetical protein
MSTAKRKTRGSTTEGEQTPAAKRGRKPKSDTAPSSTPATPTPAAKSKQFAVPASQLPKPTPDIIPFKLPAGTVHFLKNAQVTPGDTQFQFQYTNAFDASECCGLERPL